MSNAIEILPRIKFLASFLARLPSLRRVLLPFPIPFSENIRFRGWPLCRIASLEAILAGITIARRFAAECMRNLPADNARGLGRCSAAPRLRRFLRKLFGPALLQWAEASSGVAWTGFL